MYVAQQHSRFNSILSTSITAHLTVYCMWAILHEPESMAGTSQVTESHQKSAEFNSFVCSDECPLLSTLSLNTREEGQPADEEENFSLL